MNKLLTFFWSIDEKLWKDQINTNRYFATISLLLVALCGAVQGGGGMLANLFDWNTEINPVGNLGFVILLFGLNAYESLIASEKISIALCRCGLLLVVMGATLALSFIMAGIIILLIAAIVAIWLIGAVFSAAIFGGPDKGTITDSFGRKVKLKKNMWGEYEGSDGEIYNDNHDGTVTKK